MRAKGVKKFLLICSVALFPAIAQAQEEPIPGYFEQEVAYCIGYNIANYNYFSNDLKKACRSKGSCSGDSVLLAWCDKEMLRLQRYLVTGTPDDGSNPYILVAVNQGINDANEPTSSPNYYLDQSGYGEKCNSVEKELPY